MSSVTLYTLPRTLVDDLARLECGAPANLFVTPDPEYVPIVLSLSEYVFSASIASSLVCAKKRPVS